MTRELLNQVASLKKINLDLYDHVFATCNERYTMVEITFFQLQVCPMGDRKWCNTNSVKLSISSILKKVADTNIWPEDYETNGSRWLWEIK